MEIKTADLAILGGGPGGYVAAIRAAKLGVKTIVIEKENLGGVCLNWGCIPTKALYHIAQTIDEMKKADRFGINISGWNFDFKKAMDRKDKIIVAQRQGLSFHFKKNNVELVSGNGKLTTNNKIMVTQENGQVVEVTAKNIIIATGSHAEAVYPFNLEDEGVIDNMGILSLTEIPESLLIIGGGVMGSEFANIFSSFGSRVTIVEMMPRILPAEDKEVSGIIAKSFGKKGINIFTDSVIEGVKKDKGKFLCKIRGGEEITADKVLISVGRKPNSTGIGLEDVGINIDEKGFIRTDSHLKTNIPNIYAIGDVIGGFQLAHVASEEGKIAAENITGKDKVMDYSVVPWAVFTSPEIGTVGLNEEQARNKGIEVCSGLFPFSNSGKAYITGETEGFIKIVTVRDTGEILGAQMVGPRCSDLVHEVAVAMKGEITIDTLAETIHTHPTLSEAVMEAAEDCFGMATHLTR